MLSETGGSAIDGLFRKHGQTQRVGPTLPAVCASAKEYDNTDSILQSEREDRLLDGSLAGELGTEDERGRVRARLDASSLVSVVRCFDDDNSCVSEAEPVDTEVCSELIAPERFPGINSSVLRENVKQIARVIKMHLIYV